MPVYDAFVVALLLSQIKAKAHNDGIQSLFNLKEKDSYICKILQQAKLREVNNIFKYKEVGPIEIPAMLKSAIFSFHSYAV